MVTNCAWAQRFGYVPWSWNCSGWCILGFFRLGGRCVSQERLGRCHMDDCHGSREWFKRRAMFGLFTLVFDYLTLVYPLLLCHFTR
ncbi:hypothetical protein BDZ89DRAFT_95131 [Hymenopellis radicata]|nr:hypothetical protein BDZ89DRAFT_95131 [Hymenopellis radicata]